MADFSDKRAAERFPINANSSCDFVSPVLEDFGPVKVKNVSSDGVGLISSQRLDAGLMIVVNLINPSKKISKTMLTRVVHCTLLPGGSFLIGGQFVTPLTYDELCVFVM